MCYDTCAKTRSFVFFVEIHIKQVAGNTTQIIIPIVDPTKPSTSSMFGIITPVTREINTITNVNALKRLSGIYLSAVSCNT